MFDFWGSENDILCGTEGVTLKQPVIDIHLLQWNINAK